jgi:V/A-type H+-transporting ATPase subunit E
MSETSKFTEDIFNAAKEKAEAIIKEAENEKQHALDQAKAQSAREAGEILSSARAEAEAVKRRTVSETRHKSKLKEELEKSKILTEVMEQTRARVIEIVKVENTYHPFLTSVVSNAISEIGLNDVVVHLNRTDLRRVDVGKSEQETAKTLGKSVKIEFSKEPIEAIGGAIVSSRDGKSRIVNTVDQRFEAMEPKLLIEASKILFGEQQH